MVVMRLPSITDSTVLARSLVRSLTLTPLAQQPQLPACCEAIESQRSAIHRNEGSARYQPPYLQQQQQHNRHVCVDSVSDSLNHHTHEGGERKTIPQASPVIEQWIRGLDLCLVDDCFLLRRDDSIPNHDLVVHLRTKAASKHNARSSPVAQCT